MKAVLCKHPGEAEVLSLGEAPKPEAGPDHILIRVKATAVNGADLLQRKGLYPPPPGASPLLGLEASGVVEALGSARADSPFKPGDRVMALLSGGGYAEWAVAHEGSVMPIPDGLSFEEAAAIPEVFLTAFLELKVLGGLGAGETALIHAGASGVGSAAIQLSRALGAQVIATAGGEDKRQACLRLGADHAIDHKAESFDERVLQLTAGKGVDCALDLIGASYWEKNIRSLGTGGRLLLVGLGGGAKTEIDLRELLRKRITVIGSTLRSRSDAEKAALVKQFVAFALPLFARKALHPVVSAVLPWENTAEAHRLLESRAPVGKVVLSVSS